MGATLRAVQQYTCNGTAAQQWQFQATTGGDVRVNSQLGGVGMISHVINNAGAAVNSGHQVTDLVSYP